MTSGDYMSYKYSKNMSLQDNSEADLNVKTLSLALNETLKAESVGCISELAEVGLDSVLEEGLLRNLPIVSTAVALYKIGGSIKDRHNLKKMIVFLNEINNGIIDEQKRQAYRQKFSSKDTFRNHEIEYLLVLIDRYINYDKPQMLAKLYLAYLDNKLKWDELTMYAEVLDRFIYGDLDMLKKGNQYSVPVDNMPDSLLRLISLGLMVESEQPIHTPTTLGSITIPVPTQKDYVVTSFGAKLIEILI